MSETAADPAQQFAALPLRWLGGRLQVLLITSRETRRWVIPKGWPMADLAPPDCAAREAFEEAGVEGNASTTPLGHYHYEKRLKNGGYRRCRVEVFALDVTRELDDWPEAGQRGRRWFDLAGAALAVEEAELAALIHRLG
jgi:8-oxo-dGTP pyrophosphatase MutT (NUDIX family)